MPNLAVAEEAWQDNGAPWPVISIEPIIGIECLNEPRDDDQQPENQEPLVKVVTKHTTREEELASYKYQSRNQLTSSGS